MSKQIRKAAQQFVNDNKRISEEDATMALSNYADVLVEILEESTPAIQQKFIERLYKVYEVLPLFWDLWSITSAKAYRPLRVLKNVECVKKIGHICIKFGQLPDSIVLSRSVRGIDRAWAPGPTTEFVKGRLNGSIVAIKSFRINQSDLKEAKEVSKHSMCETHSQIKFPDYLEIGTGVEQTRPRTHPNVSWRHRRSRKYFPWPRL